jgi:hypothetical protein
MYWHSTTGSTTVLDGNKPFWASHALLMAVAKQQYNYCGTTISVGLK